MGNGSSNERNRERDRNRNRDGRGGAASNPPALQNPVPYSPNTTLLPPPPSGYVPAYPGMPPYGAPAANTYPDPYVYLGVHPRFQGPRPFQPFGSWVYPNRYPVPYPNPLENQQRPVLVAPQDTKTIKNEINVNRSSVRLIKDPSSPGKHLVTFSFDSTSPGSVTLIWMAREGESFSFHPISSSFYPFTTEFEKGVAQKFEQPAGTGFDLSSYSPQQLQGYDGIIPLVIRTLSLSPEVVDEVRELGSNPSRPLPSNVQSQVTLASILRQKDDEYTPKVFKQKIFFEGEGFEIQEIYGIKDSNIESAQDDGDEESEDSGKMCVICLSEPRNTTVLPCRHMCMCKDCANVLRTRSSTCPVCRQPVESLLEIRVHREDGKSQASSA